MIRYSTLDSPLGPLTLAWGSHGVRALCFAEYWEAHRTDVERKHASGTWEPADAPPDFDRRLRDYFAGDLQALDAIGVDPAGTPFQQEVWAALRRIPAGTTLSYGELAASVGCKAGARAVGAANGSNPIALIIPCHRVIRGDGSLCGYGGGVWRKAWLLRHEGIDAFAPIALCAERS